MTLALPMTKEFSFPATVDRGLSEDAREVRRIRARARDAETSFSSGYSRRKAIEALWEAFVEAREGAWDGYAAEQAEPSSLIYALYFLEQLSSNTPTPEVAVDVDGEIAIEWDYGPRRIMSVRVGRDGTLSYAGLLGHATFYGVEILREVIPSAISSSIRRIIQAA